MAWEIISHEGIGPLRFGTSRNETRRSVGEVPKEFRKGEEKQPADAYDKTGFHAYFDPNDRLEFVETFSPCIVTYKGIQLSNRPIRDVMRDLERHQIHGTPFDMGWDFINQGFSLYTEDGEQVETVSAYRKGYFE